MKTNYVLCLRLISIVILLANCLSFTTPSTTIKNNANCGIRFSYLYYFNALDETNTSGNDSDEEGDGGGGGGGGGGDDGDGDKIDEEFTKTNQLARIINGKLSMKGNWPWQISLEVLHPQFGSIGHWCGAVLITNRWLLTAAHCIHNDFFNLPIAALWTAVLGDWDREIEESTEQRIQIEQIIIHEKYHNYHHDIALMKLSKKLKLQKHGPIQQICLPSEKIPLDSMNNCYVTGWGRDKDLSLTSKLLQTKIPIHDNIKCKEKYEPNITIKNGHLCAGYLNGTTGTCVGDSGGPLQCKMLDNKWYLLGITSFGSGCARPGYPDVYTKLAYYLPWLRAKINETI